MSSDLASPRVSGDDARKLIAQAPLASRTDIINLLVRCFGFQRYLEIGLGDPSWNFERVVAPDRHSVDPHAAATFRVPSDHFFGSGLGHDRYDVVFIDGLHEFEQCLRDIENALARLSPGGFIVVHDVNPPTEWHQRPPHEAGAGDWNGTVWKAIVAFRRRHPEIWLRTVDVDWGCAVLHAATRDGQAANAAALPDVDALTWSGLEQNRAAWLNLISVEDFRRVLPAEAAPSEGLMNGNDRYPTPLWSILISGVPRRIAMAQALIAVLEDQIMRCEDGAARNRIEVLYFLDNKRRTIGAKRQTLLEMANGEYVSYVDDDDDVSPSYIDRIFACLKPEAHESRPDVVVFPHKVTINGGQEGVVDMSVRYAPKGNEALADYRPGGVTPRPPHYVAVWRRTIARQARYPDINWGEDFIWARSLWPLIKHEVQAARAGELLYHYRNRADLAETENR